MRKDQFAFIVGIVVGSLWGSVALLVVVVVLGLRALWVGLVLPWEAEHSEGDRG